MFAPCWPFHASSIPEASEVVVDNRGRRWSRTGSNSWAHDGQERHEAWLLREHGPVRCPVEDQLKETACSRPSTPT
jgi:hypothetical protein